MTTDLAYTSAVELASLIRAKRLSPVELMDAVLARIDTHNPRINAFAHLAAEPAREQAKRAEAALMDGGAVGPLEGIPVTVKDLAAVRGMPMESGSPMMRGTRPSEDTVFVTRLREAGAIILGKTTTSEFGWTGVSRSPLTGVTHNPWKHGYSAGASSAGAGAAAAAGFGPLHQGSDGAGSIRMPSHFCGVFGLKPSFGRIPMTPVSTGDYTSHNGPMTRSVADAALLLSVMAGPDSLDHTSLEAWPADYPRRLNEGVRGKRVAFSPDLGHARVDPEIATLVRDAARRFAGMGANVEDATPDWGKRGPELIRLFWPAHLSRLQAKLPEWESRMDPGLVACVRLGAQVTMEQYMLARERKFDYVAAIHRWFSDWDLLLTPAVSVAAFPAELLSPAHWPQHEWDWVQWAEFSYPFNLSGNPAASVPCGFTADGLPVGLQIVGRRFDDLGVLRAAAAFEAAQPWTDRTPALD